MGLSDWLFGATPGQQAGQAVGEVAGKTIGAVFDGLYKIIDQFSTNDQEKIEAKLAVSRHQLEVTREFISDVQNARQMQTTNRSYWPGILSAVILFGFFGGGTYVLVYGLQPNMDEVSKNIINMFSVQLLSGVSAVIGFWLGSSYGSQRKDERPMIAPLTK